MKNKHCEWCDNQFQTKISYQIYCCVACREEATKEKIAKRYQALSIKNRSKKKRFCKSCGTSLSIYNDDQNCQACDVIQSDVAKALKDIKGLGNGKD
jgi:hypothetical protein